MKTEENEAFWMYYIVTQVQLQRNTQSEFVLL